MTKGNKINTGTDFYRVKGLDKTVTVHVSMAIYEKLRYLAYTKKASLQEIMREILAERLERVKG